REEVGEHDLRDRAHPGHRGAHRQSEDRLLGDRGVPDPAGPELAEQALRGLEHSPGRPDVLTQADHILVTPQFARDSLGDGFAIRDLLSHLPTSATRAEWRLEKQLWFNSAMLSLRPPIR